MKAAVLVETNHPLEIMDLECSQLDVGQVRVQMEYSGICGKQIDEILGRRGPDPHLPHLLGHEGSGVVTEIGPGVRKVKPGDKVVLHWMKGSGIDGAPANFRTTAGRHINAGCITTFSESTVVAENRITRIAAGTRGDVASLLGCAVTTGLGIVFNNANLKPGESIAVFGVGGVGLNVVQGAALVNAHPIVAVDLFDSKLEWARNFGASHTVNSKTQDCAAVLKELTGGKGFDVTVDATGNRQVRELAYDLASPKGRIIYAGVPGVQDKITIDSFPIHFGRQLIGSHGGETAPDQDIPRYLGLYGRGQLALDKLITHTYPLERINEALDVVRGGGAVRCQVRMAS
jgi:S-(hydroxymethyl)glutathione dehydrogenase / alcohol dehydrogenase